MKNQFYLFFLLACLSAGPVFAQTPYDKGMQKAFTLWEEGKVVDAGNLFERIAQAEMDNWLPHYYVSTINTLLSFGIKDEKQLMQQLQKAQEYLDIAKRLSPDNAEILIQQAMINTAYIAYDGQTYGMTLSGKNSQLYSKALQLAPQNPRVILSKAEWDMGSARYFGKDTAPYCADVEKAIGLFSTFKPAEKYAPSYGEDRAKQVLADCQG